MKATWNNTLLAESDQAIIIEDNHYFPSASIKRRYFRASDTTSNCPWKGTANYFDIVVNNDINKDAAWTYTTPKPAANEIKDYFAFWKGVVVSE